VNRGKGFTPSQKLIQLYKLLEEQEHVIVEQGMFIFEDDKHDNHDEQVSSSSPLSHQKKRTPTSSSPPRYDCPLCNCWFGTESDLNYHLKTHETSGEELLSVKLRSRGPN